MERILFQGVIERSIQKYVIKKRQQHAALLLLFWLVVLGAVYLFCGLWKDDRFGSSGLLLILVLVLDLHLFFSPVNANQLRFPWDHTVMLENGEIQWSQQQKEQEIRIVPKPLTKVKRVLDYGDFYYVIYLDYSSGIICQKSLLREGALSSFEALFEGKLIKKEMK